MATAQADAIPPFDREHGASARGVLTACLIGSLVLLVFCARELPAWADQKWPELSNTAKAVDDALNGLAGPYDAIHGFMQRFADKKFGD
jgi:hypothetical protein